MSTTKKNEQLRQTAVSGGFFDNQFIGKQDSNGIELMNGDKIEIEVCKPDGANRSGVYHKGTIIYKNTAFCILKEDGRITPITNYAHYCKITKK